MKEIGGYLELDKYHGEMRYETGYKLNCGRNALAYLLKKKNIKKILMPKFMCDSCDKVLKDYQVEVRYYSIGLDFRPLNLCRKSEDEWIYVVNYYGQLSNSYIKNVGKNIIVDNAQAYFQNPIAGVDTIYTCRKFFGVPDGAILFTDTEKEELEQDISFKRIEFLLGRFENNASDFYGKYVSNEKSFDRESIKKMSKLTENFLHGIDYDYIEKRRTENFQFLHNQLSSINQLKLTIPDGAFMYPLYINDGERIRYQLQKQKIYIPMLWPSVVERCAKEDLEITMARNILPLPVDQRYGEEEMQILVDKIYEELEYEYLR